MARKFQIKRGLRANLPALAQGEFAMTTDSGTEALWLGTGSKNKKIPLDPSAADVGAVNKAGDTMTGALSVKMNTNSVGGARVRYSGDTDGGALFGALASAADDTSKRALIKLRHTQSSSKEALQLLFGSDENSAIFNVFHAGNKPSGTYTGNGSAASRTINVGGIGGVVLIRHSGGMVLVGPTGGFGNLYGSTEVSAGAMYFSNGIITLQSSSALVNTNGVTYYYQVL